ncbi:UDP-glycosyltransferase UGT5-like [Penaeus japonicus]|uniref:UDP-glycosyltransferase UGT5-like n=1 Tax=Penaeus japonicus TaxID=27405 RepID=UPI001C71705D|nr:UDP-glycosyltransferase UGT5-like [Penaeus japonicus]
MTPVTLWVWAACAGTVLLGAAVADLPPPERHYDILILLPMSSTSHRNIFMPVAEALAERGHKVVMLINHPLESRNPNITLVFHGLDDFRPENISMFRIRKDVQEASRIYYEMFEAVSRKFYKVPKVKRLYERRKEFDLIIVFHMMNEIAYPFVHGRPYITITTVGVDATQSAALGNVLNPAYVSNFVFPFPQPLSFYHRFLNLLLQIGIACYWKSMAMSGVQKELSSQFPDFPSLVEIERNQSLTLMNSHFSLDTPLPLLPSQVEIGGMHCRPGNPLPQDLESWISGAGAAGVVYFSLGSTNQGVTLPAHYRDILLEAFRRIDQRVLWKTVGEVDGVPENVLVRKWVPQQDVLAHPNVKVFISHAGLLSTQEAAYHATPVLALPIMADQPRNAANIKGAGFGLALEWEEITVDLVLETLRDLIDNPRYKASAEEISGAMRDQPVSPKDRAVFWTEYVIRHQGARKLRCPAADLSWVEFLMLDVLAALLLAVCVSFVLLKRLGRAVCRAVCRDESKEKRD